MINKCSKSFNSFAPSLWRVSSHGFAFRHRLLAGGILIVFLLIPAFGQACPKCFASTSKQVLHAYYISIAFMGLIPFGIVGSILGWLLFKQRQIHRRMDVAQTAGLSKNKN
jgi:hypothetical protein